MMQLAASVESTIDAKDKGYLTFAKTWITNNKNVNVSAEWQTRLVRCELLTAAEQREGQTRFDELLA